MINTNISYSDIVLSQDNNRRTEVPNSCYVAPTLPCFRLSNSGNIDVVTAAKCVPIGDIHPIPKSITSGVKYNLSNWYFRNISSIYKVEDNKGINYRDSRVRNIDYCLAAYSKKVAQTMDVASACYTGVKHALWSAGVLNDYADMPKGSAHNAIEYFDSHPDKFEKLNVPLNQLRHLPAGCIIVYCKDGYDGHIAITNGYGQETSDCTDNMRWVERRGKGASYCVYRLTDNWTYNSETKKLQFN